MSPCEKSRETQESNDQIPNEQNESKKMVPPKKVYTYRNSVLTDLMEVSHLQTVYNISVAVFNLFLLNAVLYYLSAPNMFQRDMEIMLWATSNVKLFVVMWLSFNIYAFLVFQGFKSWVRVRNKMNAKLVDIFYLVAYSAAIVFMFVATTRVILQSSFRPISNFAIMCEQVRIFMKIYSFVKESVPRVLHYKPSKDGNQEHNLYPTTKHFTYFLFAPALIYRDSYPRKKEIDWDFIGHNLFKFFACIFITYCVFTRFVVDVFQNTGLRPFTLPEASLVLAGAMAVGSMMMFLMFYGILHSWLNVFAELLGFGDREFYQDWWNSTSFSQYYRKWNTVVHDWLYTYVYMEAHKLKCGRPTSMILVFAASAAVHEYIIALSMGFFYPVLMSTYLTIGMIVIFITRKKTGQFWNTFMWSMLFSGWGTTVCLYALEWYARANCPGSNNSPPHFFEARSWDSTCHIIQYSQ